MSSNSIDDLVEKWTVEQNDLSKLVIVEDQFDTIKLIGGLDISFIKNKDDACVTIAILSYPDLKVVHQVSKMVTLKYPYISGFLGFREVDHFMDLLANLDPKFKPQLLFVDGNGIFHHRKFGSASHIGVLSGFPSIGISKNLLHLEQFSNEWLAEEMDKSQSENKSFKFRRFKTQFRISSNNIE